MRHLIPERNEYSGTWDFRLLREVSSTEWAIWYQKLGDERTIRRTQLNTLGSYISTVFIGLEDEVFETMVFDETGGWWAGYMRRCETYDEALAQHEAIKNMFLRTEGELIE